MKSSFLYILVLIVSLVSQGNTSIRPWESAIENSEAPGLWMTTYVDGKAFFPKETAVLKKHSTVGYNMKVSCPFYPKIPRADHPWRENASFNEYWQDLSDSVVLHPGVTVLDMADGTIIYEVDHGTIFEREENFVEKYDPVDYNLTFHCPYDPKKKGTSLGWSDTDGFVDVGTSQYVVMIPSSMHEGYSVVKKACMDSTFFTSCCCQDLGTERVPTSSVVIGTRGVEDCMALLLNDSESGITFLFHFHRFNFESQKALFAFAGEYGSVAAKLSSETKIYLVSSRCDNLMPMIDVLRMTGAIKYVSAVDIGLANVDLQRGTYRLFTSKGMDPRVEICSQTLEGGSVVDVQKLSLLGTPYGKAFQFYPVSKSLVNYAFV